MDEYQHPVYFEARDLMDKEEQKVRRHFQKRRVSGGGDCGMIEKDGANTYKICFKEKEGKESQWVEMSLRQNMLEEDFVGNLDIVVSYRPGKGYSKEVSHHLASCQKTTPDCE